jgi:hypothetical protein
MPEDAPMTPDPVAVLARFIPGDPRIDRDELLFRAGRTSARVGRWKATVAALAVTQAATLLALVATRREPAVTIVPAEPGPAEPEPVGPDYGPLPAHSYGALARTVDTGSLPPPTAAGVATPDRPPLSVASAYNSSGID